MDCWARPGKFFCQVYSMSRFMSLCDIGVLVTTVGRCNSNSEIKSSLTAGMRIPINLCEQENRHKLESWNSKNSLLNEVTETMWKFNVKCLTLSSVVCTSAHFFWKGNVFLLTFFAFCLLKSFM